MKFIATVLAAAVLVTGVPASFGDSPLVGQMNQLQVSASQVKLVQMLAPGSRFGRNSVEVDVILSRINGLLQNNRLLAHRNRRIIYLQELKLLKTLGLLRRDTKVFYPLSGIDLFPALFVDRIWTADDTFSKEGSWGLFCELWRKAKEDCLRWQDDEEIPSLEGCGKITYDRENVQHETLVRRWTSQMHPGDMVFLKFTRDYFIAYGDSGDRREQIKRWMKHFVELIPEGVNIVVIEGMGGNNVFDRGLTNYLLKTNLVEDIAPSLLSAQQLEQLRVINWKSEQYVEKVAGIVDFMSGGALSILKKTSLALGSRVEGQRVQEMPDDLLVGSHREALKQLSCRQREVLTALFIENKTRAQVARKLGIIEQAVSNYRMRGLRALRNLLAKSGPAPRATDRLEGSRNVRGSV